VLVLGLTSAPALAAPVSVGHSGWAWGNPTPQGDALSEVAFDGPTGYAVGMFGTVVRSQDSGATWTGLPSGTVDDLTVVQQVSPSVVVVGGGCTVRESVNSGASFLSLPINPTDSSCPTNVASFSFSDPTHGYVELTDGTMLFTSDAGQTVQAKTSAPVNGGVATALDFLSPTTGFAVSGGTAGGVIERTTDSANSWTEVGSAASGLNGITFVNPTTAYAVGDHNTLLESLDGGASWSKQPLALPPGAGPFNLAHISCSSPTTCLISTKDGRELIRTVDSGLTGTIVNPSSQLLFDVAFSTGTSVVGVGDKGATVLSADAGVTFPTVISSNLHLVSSDAAEIRPGGASGSAYIPGASGQIAATTTGGASWKLLRAPTTNTVADVAFPTTTKGFELESDGTFRSTANGGQSWRSVDTGVANASTLAATSGQNVLLIGPRGVNRSTDGGATFNAVPGKVVLAAKPRKRTIAVGRLALQSSQTIGATVLAWGTTRLVESKTGGRSWAVIPTPLPKAALDGVSFVSATTGYVLTGGASRLFFTRDSGRKWSEIDSLGGSAVANVSFSSASDGIAAVTGAGGSATIPFNDVDVLRTGDGGRTWQPEIIDGNQSGVILASHGVDYYANLVSTFAGLFATTNGGVSPRPSVLSISIGHPKLTVKALKQAGHKVTVKGRLKPVTSNGERVTVSYRRAGGSWSQRQATVASNGAFTVVIGGIRGTTDFVAQAVGNGLFGGAGTPAARLTVTRR
jgi:photosystem II stability/assembly factor-like uncharacterized protein